MALRTVGLDGLARCLDAECAPSERGIALRSRARSVLAAAARNGTLESVCDKLESCHCDVESGIASHSVALRERARLVLVGAFRNGALVDAVQPSDDKRVDLDSNVALRCRARSVLAAAARASTLESACGNAGLIAGENFASRSLPAARGS